MKIVDPIGGRRSGPPRRRRKSCCCGCLLASPVVALALLALLGWLVRGERVAVPQADRVAAERLQDKIDTLGNFYDPTRALRGEEMPTTELTQGEINSYLGHMHGRLDEQVRDAVEGLSVDLQDGRFVVSSSLNLSELGGPALESLPSPWHYEARVDVQGLLEWVEGKGRLTIERVRIGSLDLSGATALWILARVYPKSRPYIELAKGFPLPFGTLDLRVRPGKLLVQGS